MFYHVTNRKAWKAIKEEGVLFGVHGHGDWAKRNIKKNSGESYRYTYLSPEPFFNYGTVVLQVKFEPKREDFGKIHNYGFDPPPDQICWQFSVFKPIPLSDVKYCFWYSVQAILIRAFWKIRFTPFVDKIVLTLTQCPDCKGEYIDTEVITDDGLGPRYSCVFCKNGYVNPFKKLYLILLFAYYNKARNA